MSQKISQQERLSDRMLAAREKLVGQQTDISFQMAPAGSFRGVEYVNDAAATSVKDVFHSLRSIETQAVWIVYANQYNADYTPLKTLVKEKLRSVIAVGPYRALVLDQLYEVMDHYANSNSLASAVALSSFYGVQGDIVLFSPGCPAQPDWPNLRARGIEFNQIVNQYFANSSSHGAK